MCSRNEAPRRHQPHNTWFSGRAQGRWRTRTVTVARAPLQPVVRRLPSKTVSSDRSQTCPRGHAPKASLRRLTSARNLCRRELAHRHCRYRNRWQGGDHQEAAGKRAVPNQCMCRPRRTHRAPVCDPFTPLLQWHSLQARKVARCAFGNAAWIALGNVHRAS